MKTKITQFIPALIVLAVIGLRFISLWCTSDGQVCSKTLLDQMFPYIITPLYLSVLYLLPIATILIFIPRGTFNSWVKFAVWMIPVLLVFVATQPVSPRSFLSTDRNDAARLVAEIFTVVSLILIIWKYFVARKARSV